MTTTYSNSSHPVLARYLEIAAIVLGVICFILCVVLSLSLDRSFTYLEYLGFVFVWTGWLLDHFQTTVTIDDEADSFTCSFSKKYPLKISRLKTVTYKESRKGRLRSLIVHDDGVGFLDIRTSKKNADMMVEHLLKINPSIEVRHASYV